MWREFVKSLLARRLTGVQLVVSDAHAAERIARAAVDHGKAAAIHLPAPERARDVRLIGFSFLSCSFESQLLRVASERTVGALRPSSIRPP